MYVPWAWVVKSIALLAVLPRCSARAHPSNMHTIFLAECSEYFQWQSAGMFYSHRKSGQPGPVTRVMCCEEEAARNIPDEWMALGPTHIAPSWALNPHNGDHYGAYNKPLAVVDWLTRALPEEEWIVILDADMILRLPFICKSEPGTESADVVDQSVPVLRVDCQRGHPHSAFYGYLIGSTNGLAEHFLPDVKPRNDTSGGQPKGRRADQVGGMLVVHRDDMLQYMHDWITITEEVRFYADAWKLSGDVYATKPGDKPWISEMYGYVFAAAKHDMWHSIDRTSMLYPGYLPTTPPRLLHYGLEHKVNTTTGMFRFDKHWHYHFAPLKCPPWSKLGEEGLFEHPPPPSTLLSPAGTMERLRDVIVLEFVNTLNEGLCERHVTQCPNAAADVQLQTECAHTVDLAEAIRQELIFLGEPAPPSRTSLCRDHDKRCSEWVPSGTCVSNAGFMAAQCTLSCNFCNPTLPLSQLWDAPPNFFMGSLSSEFTRPAPLRLTEGLLTAESLSSAPDEQLHQQHRDHAPDDSEVKAPDIGGLGARKHDAVGHPVLQPAPHQAVQTAGDGAVQRVVSKSNTAQQSAGDGAVQRHVSEPTSEQQSVYALQRQCERLATQVQIDCLQLAAEGVPFPSAPEYVREPRKYSSSERLTDAKRPNPARNGSLVVYAAVAAAVWMAAIVGVAYLASEARRRRGERMANRRSLLSVV